MKNKFALFIYPKAEIDMEIIFDYISNELSTPDAAINLINKFYSSLENVRYFPSSCPLTLNVALKDKNIRKLCIDNYIIFYKIMNLKNKLKLLEFFME